MWLSEVMSQQTTLAAMTPYWRRFTGRWPTVEALAAADEGEVMAAWAGLGYYARARNLYACARAVAADGGRFPTSAARLKALPGIGDYTAGAIAAIAFGEPVVAVDGNAERVAARVTAERTPLPTARPTLRRTVAGWGSRRPPRRLRAGNDGPGGARLHPHAPPNASSALLPTPAEPARRGNRSATPSSSRAKSARTAPAPPGGWSAAARVALVRRAGERMLGGTLAAAVRRLGRA